MLKRTKKSPTRAKSPKRNSPIRTKARQSPVGLPARALLKKQIAAGMIETGVHGSKFRSKDGIYYYVTSGGNYQLLR